MMEIQKEREAFLHEFEKTEQYRQQYGFYKIPLKYDEQKETWNFYDVQAAWEMWQSAKSHAVLEWKDYTQQSPRIDGRYQIFISGEQLAADWKSPFGFADPVEGDAFIQDLITHWAVLSADPVIKAQEQSHE